MSQEVFSKKCEKCGLETYGFLSSVFEKSMTILYECPGCAHMWSEDELISATAEPPSETQAR